MDYDTYNALSYHATCTFSARPIMPARGFHTMHSLCSQPYVSRIRSHGQFHFASCTIHLFCRMYNAIHSASRAKQSLCQVCNALTFCNTLTFIEASCTILILPAVHVQNTPTLPAVQYNTLALPAVNVQYTHFAGCECTIYSFCRLYMYKTHLLCQLYTHNTLALPAMNVQYIHFAGCERTILSLCRL